jgi:hypothetical protein
MTLSYVGEWNVANLDKKGHTSIVLLKRPRPTTTTTTTTTKVLCLFILTDCSIFWVPKTQVVFWCLGEET